MLGLALGLVPTLLAEDGIIIGTVRDSHGTPQMGAMVQAINLQASSTDPAIAGTAFTDMRGHYSFPGVEPGKYQIKATAALFLPALRDNLRLRPGAQAVVNLTLSTLSEAVQWLPAQKRRADEPDDDWKWTLRSAANRPILRMLEDGPLVMVSTSNNEQSKPSLQARVALESGDGGFGDGGIHNAFTVDRVLGDGSGVILRADLGSPEMSYPVTASADLTAGYERKLNPMSAVRTVISYQNHPGLLAGMGQPGLQAVTLQSAEQIEMGDMLALDVGSELSAVRMDGSAAAIRPFAKVTFRPAQSWLLAFRMATARDMQGWEDMDAVQPELPVAVMERGPGGRSRLQMDQGVHQEASLGLKTGRGILQTAIYHDNLERPIVAGGGVLTGAQLAAGDVIADPMTGNFRMLGPRYQTNGLRVSATEPLTPTMWAVVEFATGDALATRQSAIGGQATAGGSELQSGLAALRVRPADSLTVALRGIVLHSGTHVRAMYRWQPQSTVTPVDSYNAFSDQPYFSFYVRQPLHLGHMIPNGVEALVDVTNLLAQGYHPVLSSDGQTLFFAQCPRTLQGGLSFTF